MAARLYAREGFAVAVDDVIAAAKAAALEAEYPEGFEVHRVLLQLRLEIALGRNAARTNKTFETARLDPIIRHVFSWMKPED